MFAVELFVAHAGCWSMATATRRDWDDEKTSINAEPAVDFGWETSGERRVAHELSDLFEEDINETTEFDQTQVRNLPSTLLRAAGRIAPPEFKTTRPPLVSAPINVFVDDLPPPPALPSLSSIGISSMPPPLPSLSLSVGADASMLGELSRSSLAPPLPALFSAPERRHRPWIWIPAGIVAVALVAVTTALLLVR
jgi:hypothetical protein